MTEHEIAAAEVEGDLDFIVRRGEELAADVDDLLLVYSAATSPNGQDVRARRDIIVRHTRHDDAVGVLALLDGKLVGFCYGTRSLAGQWWHDHVSAALDRAAQERWLRDTFVICELAVAPDAQRHGIGSELIRRVLALPEARRRKAVVLSADMDNPVDTLYRRFGFEDVVEGLPFVPDGSSYRIMGRHRDAHSPDPAV